MSRALRTVQSSPISGSPLNGRLRSNFYRSWAHGRSHIFYMRLQPQLNNSISLHVLLVLLILFWPFVDIVIPRRPGPWILGRQPVSATMMIRSSEIFQYFMYRHNDYCTLEIVVIGSHLSLRLHKSQTNYSFSHEYLIILNASISDMI